MWRQTITATPRQLESLIRISEALARMRLSATVERADAAEALRLMQVWAPLRPCVSRAIYGCSPRRQAPRCSTGLPATFSTPSAKQ